MGRSANRVHRELDVKKDKYGIGETQIWSGPLANGDQVVVFLNAADENLEMKAGLADIFVTEGPECSSAQCKQSWTIYDLWSNRMKEGVAEEILEADTEKAAKLLEKAKWFNSTETSYKEGLANGDERLFGAEVGLVDAKGTLMARVPRHGVAAFRLRSRNGAAKRYSTAHEEL